jgi:homoserine kinase
MRFTAFIFNHPYITDRKSAFSSFLNMKKRIVVPASTANLGPAFDVLGAALSLFVTLTFEPSSHLEIHYTGEGSVETNTNNFVYQVASYVANCEGRKLPNFTLWIDNQIPLGRGLGSSGSAVVGGIILAFELLSVKWANELVAHYATMVEGHPDNVCASIYGNWVTSVMCCALPPWTPSLEVGPNDFKGKKLLLSNQFSVNSTLKAVVCIPSFELPTSKARGALPSNYTRQDIIFNMSRSVGLVWELQKLVIDHQRVRECMNDRIHQPYRSSLVPGLEELLKLEGNGILGLCLSGAGPTCLCIADGYFDSIGQKMVKIFHEKGVESTYKVLDFVQSGAVVNTFE